VLIAQPEQIDVADQLAGLARLDGGREPVAGAWIAAPASLILSNSTTCARVRGSL